MITCHSILFGLGYESERGSDFTHAITQQDNVAGIKLNHTMLQTGHIQTSSSPSPPPPSWQFSPLAASFLKFLL